MQQINSDPPNLFRRRGPYRGMWSKDWTPASAAQRVGGFMFGVIFVVAGVMAAVMSFFVRSESPHIPLVFSFFVVAWALAIAALGIWLGGRLLAGSLRHAEIAMSKNSRQGK